jgi:hypothetical protein
MPHKEALRGQTHSPGGSPKSIEFFKYGSLESLSFESAALEFSPGPIIPSLVRRVMLWAWFSFLFLKTGC